MVPLWIPLLFFTETLQVMCVLLQASRGRCRPVHRWLFNTGEEGVTQLFNQLIFQSHVKTVKHINVQTFIRCHSEGARVRSVTFL